MNKEVADQMIKALELRQALNNSVKLTDEEQRQYNEVMEAEKTLIASLKQIQAQPEVPLDNIQRIELRNYLHAYGEGNKVTGAEAEMNQGLGLNDMSQIPLEALLDLEERTDDPTNLTQGTFNKQVRPILPRLFEAD